MSKPTEKELLQTFKKALTKKDEAEKKLKDAKKEYDEAEFKLLEFLENASATSTAVYEGLGGAKLKTQLRASCKVENKDRLFLYLKERGVEDLIVEKKDVSSSDLASYVKDCIEKGVEVPEFITYYIQNSLKPF